MMTLMEVKMMPMKTKKGLEMKIPKTCRTDFSTFHSIHVNFRCATERRTATPMAKSLGTATKRKRIPFRWEVL